MQTSEFLHLLGHSSGSAGSWDVFRGRWHNTAISGILIWRCVLSRAGWRVSLHYFPSSFSISSTCQVGHLDLEILLSHRTFHRIFVTSFAGRYIDCRRSKFDLLYNLNLPAFCINKKRAFYFSPNKFSPITVMDSLKNNGVTSDDAVTCKLDFIISDQ